MKITDKGWAVVEWDTLLSRDVEEQGRLDVAAGALGHLQKYVPRGGVVVDVGACIGDHTVMYANWVGKAGVVHAFEPNPVAFECLKWNMARYGRAFVYNFGLAANTHICTCTTLDTNLGATYLTESESGNVQVVALDTLTLSWKRLDFIKIDVEGYEPQVLDGARETIARFRPVMLVEISAQMLGFHGRTCADVLDRIAAHGYLMSYSPKGQYDLLCVPMERVGLL